MDVNKLSLEAACRIAFLPHTLALALMIQPVAADTFAMVALAEATEDADKTDANKKADGGDSLARVWLYGLGRMRWNS